MRMYIALIGSFCSFIGTAKSQPTDSLRQVIAQSKEDSSKVFLLRKLARTYLDSRPDSCYYYASWGLRLAQKLHEPKGESICLSLIGTIRCYIGDFPQALEISLRSLRIAEQVNDAQAVGDACNSLGIIYYFQKSYRKAMEYYIAALATTKDGPGEEGRRMGVALGNVGEDYFKLNMPDSSRYYINLAYGKAAAAHDAATLAFDLAVLGDTYARSDRDGLALEYYRNGVPLEMGMNDQDDLCHGMLGMAGIFERRHRVDSAMFYAYRSLQIAMASNFIIQEMEATNCLAGLYESEKKTDSTLKYLKMTIALKDSLFSQDKSNAIQSMTFQENIRQQDLANQQKDAEITAGKNLQRAGIAVFIPIFFLFVLFLSRRRVRPRVIEFLAVVGLLLSFEFITDLIFPYISDWTNDSPIWETLILVAIAAVLEPLNYKIERWVNKRLAAGGFSEF
jgi:tetratricopeptide (TPR) repeat protein